MTYIKHLIKDKDLEKINFWPDNFTSKNKESFFKTLLPNNLDGYYDAESLKKDLKFFINLSYESDIEDYFAKREHPFAKTFPEAYIFHEGEFRLFFTVHKLAKNYVISRKECLKIIEEGKLTPTELSFSTRKLKFYSNLSFEEYLNKVRPEEKEAPAKVFSPSNEKASLPGVTNIDELFKVLTESLAELTTAIKEQNDLISEIVILPKDKSKKVKLPYKNREKYKKEVANFIFDKGEQYFTPKVLSKTVWSDYIKWCENKNQTPIGQHLFLNLLLDFNLAKGRSGRYRGFYPTENFYKNFDLETF